MTRERRPVSFRRLSWLAALLAAVFVAGAYVAYGELLHYTRRAAAHLPADTIFAARLDVEQVTLFDPVRRHLLPLVEVLPPSPAREPEQSRLARLREAGLNLGLDLREIVVATTDRGWLVVLGGLFPDSGMVSAVAHVLHDENAEGWQLRQDRLELSASGAVLAQAPDGVLIVASDASTLSAALPPSSRHRELGLAGEGLGGAALAPGALAQAAGADWRYPGPPGWLAATRVVASLRPARDVELELRVELDDPDRARQLADQARSWSSVGAGALHQPAGGQDPAGLWARTHTVEAEGTALKLLSSWRSSELERSARELAAWVRRQLPAADRAGS